MGCLPSSIKYILCSVELVVLLSFILLFYMNLLMQWWQQAFISSAYMKKILCWITKVYNAEYFAIGIKCEWMGEQFCKMTITLALDINWMAMRFLCFWEIASLVDPLISGNEFRVSAAAPSNSIIHPNKRPKHQPNGVQNHNYNRYQIIIEYLVVNEAVNNWILGFH